MGPGHAPVGPNRPPTPVFESGSTLWSRVKRIGQGVFSVIGVAMTLYGAYGVLVPPSDVQRILFMNAEHELVSQSHEFPVAVTIGGVDASNRDLTETFLTLWRDGGKPITAEMTRRPLRITLPGGSHLIAYAVIGTDSSVPDNFGVERFGDDLLVHWKVWDPDMAIKIAMVRSGQPANLALSGEVGPGVEVSGVWMALRLQSGMYFSLGLALVSLLGLSLSLVVYPSAWLRWVPSPSIRSAVLLVLIIGITALGLSGTRMSPRFSAWLSSKIVKPIPFSDAQ